VIYTLHGEVRADTLRAKGYGLKAERQPEYRLSLAAKQVMLPALRHRPFERVPLGRNETWDMRIDRYLRGHVTRGQHRRFELLRSVPKTLARVHAGPAIWRRKAFRALDAVRGTR